LKLFLDFYFFQVALEYETRCTSDSEENTQLDESGQKPEVRKKTKIVKLNLIRILNKNDENIGWHRVCNLIMSLNNP